MMKTRSLLLGVLFLLGAIVTLFSLMSFSPTDSSWFFEQRGFSTAALHNYLGLWGAAYAALLVYVFGGSSFFLVLLFVFLSLYFFQFRPERFSYDAAVWAVCLVISLSMLCSVQGVDFFNGVLPGGALGLMLQSLGVKIVGAAWTLFFSTMLLCCSLIGIFQFSWVSGVINLVKRVGAFCGISALIKRAKKHAVGTWQRMKNYFHRRRSGIEPEDPVALFVRDALDQASAERAMDILEDPLWQTLVTDKQDEIPLIVAAEEASMEGISPEITSENSVYHLPLLAPKSTTKVTAQAEKGIKKEQDQRARLLEEKLARFGIHGSVTSITQGPVVTLFEYQPAADVKISKIVAREDDLTLALQAVSLRIIAPVPGKSVIGFEVANTQRQAVYFSEIVAHDSWATRKAELPIVLGKNCSGEPVIVDITTLPHLLVAGSTGSGKSVGLNVMLMSLLCSKTPDELRLILIDPKRLEFSPYADCAHLIFPIITEPKKALAALSWAVKTMNDRYEQMAAKKVRNIYEYRARYGAMPSLVIMIDELADLMMTTGRETEEMIARLAQMARAAGIHLIVATQRPSVDVITGVVKINFPSRLSFKVASKIDSRTILDAAGAEKLLGKGDMLYLSSQGMLQRIHGAYVSDEEINQVVNLVKAQRKPDYQELQSATNASAAMLDEDSALYQEVVRFLEQVDEVSISLLQRKFRIGYNRSARLIEMLEAQGLLIASESGKTRRVIR